MAYRFGFEREVENGLDRLADLTLEFDVCNAVRCMAYAAQRRKTHGHAVLPEERETYDACLQRARESLSAFDFEIEWQAGQWADARQLLDRLATIIQEKYYV